MKKRKKNGVCYCSRGTGSFALIELSDCSSPTILPLALSLFLSSLCESSPFRFLYILPLPARSFFSTFPTRSLPFVHYRSFVARPFFSISKRIYPSLSLILSHSLLPPPPLLRLPHLLTDTPSLSALSCSFLFCSILPRRFLPSLLQSSIYPFLYIIYIYTELHVRVYG